ncbi:MAG: molybdate ABC transporter substrate-binding protein [Kiritimatiellales bacterium]|nr:molybdate ABC transporter substrate-binding protein [Kiritimatiellales bacterium]
MKNRMIQTVAVLLLIASSVCAENLIVLAAASTTDAMNEIGTLFMKQSGHTVQFSFGSSGALARQIQNGAPADVFLSANEKWMDTLEKGGAVSSATRTDLLANRLVLIVPKGRSATLDERFAGRLAVGSMKSVPAGMYAKQVLEKMSLLEILKPRLVSCDSVRNVLFFVERGEVDAGIVYSTDAKISDRVTIVSVFPEELHDPIRYPVGVCTASAHAAAAAEFLTFLESDEARAVFEKLGFSVIAEGGK